MPQAAKEKENYFSAYKLFAKTREGRDPAWLVTLREKGASSFDSLDFPTARTEEWKYTNVAPILKSPFRQVFDLGEPELTLKAIAPFTFEGSRRSQLVFINGLFSPAHSDVSGISGAAVVSNFSEVPPKYGRVISKHLGIHADYRSQAFTALNTAHIGDGAFVYVPAGRTIEKPIHVLFISTAGEPTASHPRVLIVAGSNSIASVIESYVSPDDGVYFTNAVTEVVTEEGAVLDHYRLQEESRRA